MFFQYSRTGFAKSEHTPMTCEEKLNLLEPANPKTIYDLLIQLQIMLISEVIINLTERISRYYHQLLLHHILCLPNAEF